MLSKLREGSPYVGLKIDPSLKKTNALNLEYIKNAVLSFNLNSALLGLPELNDQKAPLRDRAASVGYVEPKDSFWFDESTQSEFHGSDRESLRLEFYSPDSGYTVTGKVLKSILPAPVVEELRIGDGQIIFIPSQSRDLLELSDAELSDYVEECSSALYADIIGTRTDTKRHEIEKELLDCDIPLIKRTAIRIMNFVKAEWIKMSLKAKNRRRNILCFLYPDRAFDGVIRACSRSSCISTWLFHNWEKKKTC